MYEDGQSCEVLLSSCGIGQTSSFTGVGTAKSLLAAQNSCTCTWYLSAVPSRRCHSEETPYAVRRPLHGRRFLLFVVFAPLLIPLWDVAAVRSLRKRLSISTSKQTVTSSHSCASDTLTCPTGALVRLTFHHAGRLVTVRHNWLLTRADNVETLSKDFRRPTTASLRETIRESMTATPLCDKGESVMGTVYGALAWRTIRFLCSTSSGGHALGSCTSRSKRSTNNK